jgi:hypothetical protein
LFVIRALQRVGFQVKQADKFSGNQNASKIQLVVEVISKSQEKFWQTQVINNHSDVYVHNSLYELIEFLNF